MDKVLFVSDSTGAIDLEMSPDNPNELYAAMWRGERKPWTIISGAASENGIYKSTRRGRHLDKARKRPAARAHRQDRPRHLAANPDRIYALVEAPEPKEGLYRSDDRGQSFRLVSNEGGLMRRPFYYTNVDADPTDADVVYVNNEGFFKSTDGGETFERIATPHGDNHDMWINPDDPDVMVQSNDGGANVSLGRRRDVVDADEPAHRRTLPTPRGRPVSVLGLRRAAGQHDDHGAEPPARRRLGVRAGGELERGRRLRDGSGGAQARRSHHRLQQLQGAFRALQPRPGQEKQYYVGAQNMYGQNPANLTHRFQRVVPIAVSPHNPDVVYHASQYLHRTSDEARPGRRSVRT